MGSPYARVDYNLTFCRLQHMRHPKPESTLSPSQGLRIRTLHLSCCSNLTKIFCWVIWPEFRPFYSFGDFDAAAPGALPHPPPPPHTHAQTALCTDRSVPLPPPPTFTPARSEIYSRVIAVWSYCLSCAGTGQRSHDYRLWTVIGRGKNGRGGGTLRREKVNCFLRFLFAIFVGTDTVTACMTQGSKK